MEKERSKFLLTHQIFVDKVAKEIADHIKRNKFDEQTADKLMEEIEELTGVLLDFCIDEGKYN